MRPSFPFKKQEAGALSAAAFVSSLCKVVGFIQQPCLHA